MKHRIKIEKNILYVRNIGDPDPDFEIVPINSISFLSKLMKSVNTSDEIIDNPHYHYIFIITIPGGNITLRSFPFQKYNENDYIIRESIQDLRNARKIIAEAIELYHGGIMIGKPKRI